MERLKRRTDFKAAAKGERAPAAAFVLQARRRAEDGQAGGRQYGQKGNPARVGFTVSRQVGNAVERNRVRRRLRELVRLAPAATLRPGYDYVLIGRRVALGADFAAMTRQFDAAIRRIHAAPPDGQEGGPGSGQGSTRATGAGQGAPPHRSGSPRQGLNRRSDNRSLKSKSSGSQTLQSDEHKSR